MPLWLEPFRQTLLAVRAQSVGMLFAFVVGRGLALSPLALAKLYRLAVMCGLAFGARARDKFYELVVERCLSLAESEVSLIQGVDTQIRNLRSTVDMIHAVLRDADERRFIEDDSVKLWLRAIKDLALDSDDVLDEYQTLLNVSMLHRKNAPVVARKRKWYSFLPSLSTDPIFLKRRRIAFKIVELRQNLDVISQNKQKLRLKKEDGIRRGPSSKQPPPPTGSLQDKSQPIGRDEDRDEVVRLLMLDNNEAPSVVPIVGIGGLGKTTLARLVYEDPRVKRHFKPRIWVWLSKDFSVLRALKEIIEAITGNTCDSLSLNLLQYRLRHLLTRKKFLLVLDNVWNEDQCFWETLRVPLQAGAKGSKVLITTRSIEVSRKMCGGEDRFDLKGLRERDSWLLFQDRAFPSGQHEQQSLVDIGSRIVRRCQGSPLAVLSLAGHLCSKDVEEWNIVLQEMWELESRDNSVLRTLKVSYDGLPLHLKQCFAYCSIFPDNYEFDKDELVKLWMAEGFIQPRGGSTRLEVIGGCYFDNLSWRSFFQTSDSNEQLMFQASGSNEQLKKKYKMPNLIKDLAQYVSQDECLRVEHSASHYASRKIRYSSFSYCDSDPVTVKELYGHQNLRTFILHCESEDSLKQVPYDICRRFKFLRALDLRNSRLVELPRSVGDLIHLRYLGLSKTKIRILPESLSKLYNLQTLLLDECYELRELPKGISDLVNLRHVSLHIDRDKWVDLNSMPPGIGKLSSLQTLSRFAVSTEIGCGIVELKNLNNLRGELCISKLENIANSRDAEEAKLKDKKYLESLTLRWSEGAKPSAENKSDEVINYLRPHTMLRDLQIEHYNGCNFPHWMGDPSFTNLQSLRLSHCKLKSLDQNVLLLSLTKLELRSCEDLTTLPQLDSLRDVVVVGGNRVVFDWLCKHTSLSSLTISQFTQLTHVTQHSLRNMKSLRKLRIEECDELVSVAEQESLGILSSLQVLEVLCCRELLSFAENGLPTSLRCLRLHCCEKLTSLPRALHSLNVLHQLEILRVPRIKSLPAEGLPSGLQRLTISGCPFLQQRCQQDEGADWCKIENIPSVDIDQSPSH